MRPYYYLVPHNIKGNIMSQAPKAVVMIRPHHFLPNPQTSADNTFQSEADNNSSLTTLAYEQVSNMAQKLEDNGITVHLFEDVSKATPDSVFPNNWFSTHHDGKLAIYAMYPENRRLERRSDIIDKLVSQYQVNQIIDYSPYEHSNKFLEGTGALVLDHDARVAYAVRSNRCSEQLFYEFCQQFSYRPVLFDAVNKQGTAVYHTNVIMTVGSSYVLLATEMIKDASQQRFVIEAIERTGKTIIHLTEQQIEQYCGNALELTNGDTLYLAVSQTAFNALTDEQKHELNSEVTLLPFDVEAIEYAGGSVRCMLAGIHLPNR